MGAKADQRNLVQLTIKDTAGDKTILDQPILSLSLNKNDSVRNLRTRIAYHSFEIDLRVQSSSSLK